MNWEKARKKEKYILIPIYLVAYLISYLTGVRCIWKALLGIPCPGCGFTRAVLSMLKLDFRAAFDFHPMFWSVFLLGLFFVFEGDVFKHKMANVITAIIIGGGFLIVWLYRLINGIVI